MLSRKELKSGAPSGEIWLVTVVQPPLVFRKSDIDFCTV